MIERDNLVVQKQSNQSADEQGTAAYAIVPVQLACNAGR